MLVTVAGPRSTKELRDLVKALLDRCQLYAYPDLSSAVKAVSAKHGIDVPPVQVEQVLSAMAAAQPAAGPVPSPEQVFSETTDCPVRLAELLECAWMQLAAEASAELEALDQARAFETRYQRLTLPGWCCLLLHDAVSGRPILPERVIGAVLAACIVAELLLAWRVDADEEGRRLRAYAEADYLEAERVTWLISRMPEGSVDPEMLRRADTLSPSRARLPELSAAAAGVLSEIERSGAPARLDHWFQQLSPVAADLVRGELAKAEVIKPRRGKWMMSERATYLPTDPMQVALLRGSVIGPLASKGSLPRSAAAAVLMEIVRACGLTRARAEDWFTVNTLPKRAGLAGVPHRRAFARLLDLVEEAADAAVCSPA
jgi:hypothetical protein